MQPRNRDVDLDGLLPHPKNYNRHPPEQVRRLAKSLTKFGQVRSVVVWRNTLLAGHGVAEAARILNWRSVRADVLPDDYPEHLALAYIAADNELARRGDPDMAQLAVILEESKAADADLLEAIGYSDKEFEALLREVGKGAAGVEDAGAQVDKADELRQKWGTAAGQLWQLGEHRLICGDCTDPATVARVMGGERAAAVVTDPPFNIGLAYDVYEDNKPQAEYLAMMFECFSIARGVAMESGHLVCTLGHNATWPVRAQIEQAGWAFRHIGVWHNPQRKAGGNPGMWPFAWEAVLDFTNGKFRKLNNSNGVGYMDVWIEPPGTDTVHPAERPQKMWGELVSLVSSSGEPIYEPFDGSGTTIIACENLGRRCRACEISPAYVAVALDRWAMSTGKTPVLVEG